MLGEELVRQMLALGICDAHMDDAGYVYGTIPANCAKDLPVYGLIAHMDTSPDAPGGPIHARITEAYDGGDIVLNEAPGHCPFAAGLCFPAEARRQTPDRDRRHDTARRGR